jgi:NitT/TauT family transport system substrate-binding protein
MRNFLALVIFIFSFSSFSSETYNVCWSHYTGWEPWAYAQESGILAKHAKKHGVSVNLKLIPGYMESINLYGLNSKPVKGDPCVAVTITNMDALTIPSLGGIDSEVIIVGDFSNGNDAILTNDLAVKSVLDLKGKSITGVEFSVSHYLLSRALKINNMTERNITFKNTDENNIIGTFSAQVGNTVTWNPWKDQIVKSGGRVLFDSSMIPGEIIDTMLIKTSAPESLKKALVGAWYETMQVMSVGPNKNEALKFMAEKAGGSLEDFVSQLKTTEMFYEADKAVKFTQSKSLKSTMNYIRHFSHKVGIYPQGKSADFVGIQFPDGSIEGDSKNVKLRFNAYYMDLASQGQL